MIQDSLTYIGLGQGSSPHPTSTSLPRPSAAMYPQRGWRSESSSNNAYTRFPVRPSSLPVRQDSLARNPYAAHEASRFGETSADAYLTVAGNPYGVNSVANEYLQDPYRANDAESHFQSNQTQRTQAAANNQQPAQKQRNVWTYGIMVLVTVGAVLIVMAVGVGVGASLTLRNKEASHQGGAA